MSEPSGGNSTLYPGVWWPAYQPLSHSVKPSVRTSRCGTRCAARSALAAIEQHDDDGCQQRRQEPGHEGGSKRRIMDRARLSAW